MAVSTAAPSATATKRINVMRWSREQLSCMAHTPQSPNQSEASVHVDHCLSFGDVFF